MPLTHTPIDPGRPSRTPDRGRAAHANTRSRPDAAHPPPERGRTPLTHPRSRPDAAHPHPIKAGRRSPTPDQGQTPLTHARSRPETALIQVPDTPEVRMVRFADHSAAFRK